MGQVERGLLVTDLWYNRILDPKTQVVTGLTRNGLFLVEEGRIVGPVQNLRYTQSIVGGFGPEKVLGPGRRCPAGGQRGRHHARALGAAGVVGLHGQRQGVTAGLLECHSSPTPTRRP